MMDFWDKELTVEEEDALIDRAATVIQKRRLETPAIMALEMHKPLANVGAHAALAFSPFLVPFFGFNAVNDYSLLFRNPDNVERLLRRLEGSSKSGRPDSGSELAMEEAV